MRLKTSRVETDEVDEADEADETRCARPDICTLQMRTRAVVVVGGRDRLE